MEAEMYTNDLHNAYMYETEHYKDLIRTAAQSRLASECNKDGKGRKASSIKRKLLVITALLAALVWFLA